MRTVTGDSWLSLPISEIADFRSGDFISIAQLSERSASSRIPVFEGNGIAGYTASATISEPTVILGRVGQKCGVVYRNSGPAWITDNALYARHFRRPVDVQFLVLALEAARLNDARNYNDLPLITQSILRDVKVAWPDSLGEQHRIVDALSDVVGLITSLERIISKKQAIKQGIMEQLLTGRNRLHGFNGEWKVRRIGELLTPRVERHLGDEELEVLSCTKHQGFVRSLDYFKNQVFSRDLSGYKVIRHGDIGYPANHVEEGSIGVQESYEVALVSPIYVVMRPLAAVDTYFLWRELKLDRFRREFARATNASVNRRGSLRWPRFSEIEVLVPEYDEQRAISCCLRDSEVEMQSHQRRLVKAQAMKQGMMQQLVTGRIRLPV